MANEYRAAGQRRSAAPAGAWILLATALMQAVSPAVAGFGQGSDDDPVVVPPGPFFAVWGVVVLGCLLVAARGLKRQQATNTTFRRLHVPLSIAQVGFALWLFFAATAPVLTVPAFGLILAMLVLALRRAPDGHSTKGRHGLSRDMLFTESVLGVYAGWSAAAIWINIASVTGQPPTPLLAALLSAAVASEIALLTVACRTNPARVAAGLTGIWALLGVALSTFGAGADTLGALAVAGTAAVGLATIATARRGPIHHRPAAA